MNEHAEQCTDPNTINACIGLTSANDLLSGLSIAAIHVMQYPGAFLHSQSNSMTYHLQVWRRDSC